VALAIALGRRPQLLLLDEPLAELDPLARTQIMGTLLAEAHDTGMTVLMSSHVIADLDNACDFLILLRERRVALAEDMEALLEGHRRVTGPVDRLDEVREVVYGSASGRQFTALVRGASVPAGFDAARPSLDELVLAYLQQPIGPGSGSVVKGAA
jgi:ABC-2 type transport system ATP-binding protein